MLAVISDIHGNLEALQAVLADIDGRGAARILCLGDVVGYGANPEECATLVRERCAVLLKGNHDMALVREPVGFNKAARDAILWARERMKPGLLSGRARKRNWQFLEEAAESHREEGLLFVHGSPRDPILEYVEESDTVDVGFGPSEKLKAIFDLLDAPCVVGHTHRPGIITPDREFLSPKKLHNAWRYSDAPAIINAGSVGQPRDGDPRACYITIEDQIVHYHRVEYDVEEAARKIRAVGVLDERLAERLCLGR